MFDSLKEKLGFGKKDEILTAPIEGQAVKLSEVSDPTFSQEMLGKGIAIIPTVGKVVSPVNGTIEMVFDTKHAISMTSDTGIQILIHVGIETVSLKGTPFKAYVRTGDRVKAGDLMLEFDIGAIKKAGLNIITPVIICNSYDYGKVIGHTGRNVGTTDKVITLAK